MNTRVSEVRLLWIWYSPFALGGVETFLLGQIREASRRGIEVRVAATKSASGPLREIYAGMGIETFDWSRFWPAYMGIEPGEQIRESLVADLLRYKPTAIVLNDCSDFAIGAAPLLRAIRRFTTVIDILHIDPPGDQYFELRRFYLDTLDGVASTNEDALSRFESRFGSAAPPGRYIPNGVSRAAVPRSPREPRLRLLYAGRVVDEQKRVLALPGILAELRRKKVEYEMTIAGDGDAVPELQARLQAVGVDDAVRFAGVVDPAAMPGLYVSHDLLLNLSTYEGFSMTVLEAMAGGCVPVCTDLQSLDRGVFIDGETCLLVPVDGLDRIAAKVAALSRAQLESLSANAMAAVASLTPVRTFEGYLDLLAGCAQRRPLESWFDDFTMTPWNISLHNPWIPHPHPLRRWLRKIVPGGR
jgi:Glycosyltransferase